MNRRGIGIIVLVSSFVILSEKVTWAQVVPERLVGMKQMAERVKDLAQRMPESTRNMLSSGALNLINLAERWDRIEPHLRRALPMPLSSGGPILPSDVGGALADRILAPKQVSNLSADVSSSRLAGFTQSETSTAWCGNNVVVGFNDSGSILETMPLPGIGLSLNGIARSTNKGGSFTDLGFLNPGPVITDVLAGDPVLACSDENTFYYASIFERATTSDISVSRSFDGGQTFGSPVSAVSKDGTIHFLEKAWMAVDPTNPNRIYVTYTDFDGSGSLCGFDPASGLPIPRTAIELVRSTDGDGTWSFPPVVIQEVCGDSVVQGSQVAVGPGGEVYVAWETFAANAVTLEIDIRKSTDNGVTFGALVKVDHVICAGTCLRLQGNFRSGREFPTLAVDRSGNSTNGSVYIAWHDGRNLTVPDAAFGSYGYADILVSRSTDGGATWLAPVRVNNNPEPLSSGLGTDQYQPGVAVDKVGKVGVCFYDRRRDPNNFFIDRECAFSKDAGTSWSNKRITKKNFPAIPGQDVLLNPLYMGDYDGLASDFTKTTSGFIGAWGDNSLGNPDVKAEKF
ncbi:MAG: exo-alpha-sialidase [Candidatus Methylomirabilis oxyfera]|nr:exo-alpha-sialidase [Candidatus Methylomirabilis oxyfera]